MSDIEFSRAGVKLSYLRFLSDSAAGFIVILITIISYYYPIFGISLHQLFPAPSIPISNYVGILVLVLLFLLATPLGLIINASSWIVLGPVKILWAKHWFNKSSFIPEYLVRGTKESFRFDDLKEFFNLCDKGDFFNFAENVENVFDVYYPNFTNSMDYVKGAHRLSRNIAFISVVSIMSCIFIFCFTFYEGSPQYNSLFCIIPFVVIFIVSMIISSIVCFFHHLSILSKTYILCLKNGNIENIKGDTNKIMACVLTSSLDHESGI